MEPAAWRSAARSRSSCRAARRINAIQEEQARLLKSLQGANLNLKTFLSLYVQYKMSGDFVPVTFPGELSVEIGIGIKKRAPTTFTLSRDCRGVTERRQSMNIETLRYTLLWCAVINYAVLLIWFVLYLLPHGWLHRLWSRWFHLTTEQFDTLNFAGMMLYEVGIFLLNLAPLCALYLAA